MRSIFGLLVSLANATEGGAGEPIIIMMLVGFYAYMAFEAFHTAKKRQAGCPLTNFPASLLPTAICRARPLGPVLLIVVGRLVSAWTRCM